jgi:hypothetical protein
MSNASPFFGVDSLTPMSFVKADRDRAAAIANLLDAGDGRSLPSLNLRRVV